MLILASGSPRRSELLTTLGLAFEVRPVDIDETPRLGEDPTDLVRRLAVTKAETGLDRAPEIDAVVLGADTVVACDGRILGKPADADEARRMLRTLSGRTHQVHTGVAVAPRGAAVDGSADDGAIAPAVTLAVDVASAEVSFATLSDDDIERYVVTGDPFDKAGSYGIQGEAGRFVTRLVGDRDTVVGLSLEATRRLLVGAGLAV